MKDKLYNILDDLENYKHDRKELFLMCVNERLNKSLQVYYNDLLTSFNHLKYKDSKNILKKLNR